MPACVVLAAVAGFSVLAEALPHPAPLDATEQERTAHAVAATTLGILSFAHWPGDPSRVRLCVVGSTLYADALLTTRHVAQAGGRQVLVRQRAPVDVAADCDALYLGRMSREEQREVARRIVGRPELTVGERHAGCGGASVICLDIRLSGVSFEVDLRSLAQSGVRVEPGLLKLSRNLEHRR
ncbi:DUF4154 domain-containing protein [Xylophilus rhododendri]|uniref:DUF4154 domain-containing protein n=1 Tax=Xylophilus rhododendri TaxID=2697032 RepID=A0A857J792_9BURK|nr:YfiR family protein [Xylophilus rhododendri]QHI98648.1 DUF4154 domain-containing protein [Xylophilus rhododendri]